MDRQHILKSIRSIEDKLLISRVLDKAEKFLHTGCSDYIHFGCFLTPRERSLVQTTLNGLGIVNYIFYGGYEGAERTIVIFSPDFICDNECEPDFEMLKLLNVALRLGERLSHRDYLGALMGLGIKREKIGDILVEEGSCRIVVLEEVSQYICYNLEKVGSTRADIEVSDVRGLQAADKKTRDINSTVASLRLDCLASTGFGMSRSKMAELIKSDRVSLNWEAADNPACMVKQGDVISVKGKGRIIFDTVGRTTKKDRIAVVLKKFI